MINADAVMINATTVRFSYLDLLVNWFKHSCVTLKFSPGYLGTRTLILYLMAFVAPTYSDRLTVSFELHIIFIGVENHYSIAFLKIVNYIKKAVKGN